MTRPRSGIVRGVVFAAGALAASGPSAAQGGPLDRSPSRFTLHQGHRIHYKSLGVGRTAVVFVHGWACDLTFWRGQVPAVDGRVRVLFIDLPGHGRSDKPDTTYSMDFFAGAVHAAMVAAGVDRAVLVGHSMGTPVVRQFYRRHRDAVVGLVAVDGPLSMAAMDSAMTRQFVQMWEGPNFEQAREGFLASQFPAGSDTTVARAVRASLTATPRHSMLGSIRGMLEPAIWAEDPIEVPLLLVLADNPQWTPAYLERVRSMAPRLQLERMSGVGHFLMMEQPERFNARLVVFLREAGVVR